MFFMLAVILLKRNPCMQAICMRCRPCLHQPVASGDNVFPSPNFPKATIQNKLQMLPEAR